MSDKKDNRLIILTGPTAVGKTELSISLAKEIGGEIISADSIQVYRHLDIGSAKIKKEEIGGVPHHLIDVLEPYEDFSAAVFKKLAGEAIADIYDRGHIPIIVGGTGFYIQGVLYDIDFSSGDDFAYRDELGDIYIKQGAGALHDMLKQVDPASAYAIHQNNVRRVIRALEYYRQTGRPISEHNEEERCKTSPYNFAYFVLNRDRSALYEQIEVRVDKMIAEGLIDEVKALVRDYGVTRGMVSMQGLGYKEILAYLDGECTLDEAVYTLKRDTRHFAKRQLTWFRREKDVIWLDKDYLTDEKSQLSFIKDELKKKSILT